MLRLRMTTGGVMTRRLAVLFVAMMTALAAACGSSSHPQSSKPTTPGSTAAPSGEPGVGVTPTGIKLGIALVDFNCIKPYVDGLRFDQDKVYQAFIDDVNDHGGINGRKLEPVYKTYCPIVPAPALAVCTSLTEDAKVFAILGTFVDFSGDAQKCATKQHKRVLLTFVASQEIIDGSPPGLLLTPDITPERRGTITLSLLKREKTLEGKKVGILGEAVTKDRVKKVVEPGVKDLGVETGTTAILSISGTDTMQAQTQLDSFVERWKSEGVNALVMSGDQVTHRQFVQKIRTEIPDIVLVSDTGAFIGYGQDEKKAGVNPNPYEGVLGAEGETGTEHDKGENWKKCSSIYETQTGKKAPVADDVIPLPGGKRDDTYGTIEDACTLVTMFTAIATKAGPTLNNDTWTRTVDTFGSIPVMNSKYGSIKAGKYDANDTFGLVAFDSSIGPKGDIRAVTPVVDVTASG
jgi:hypothetical protein